MDRGRGKSLERQIEIFVSPTGNYYPSCPTSKKNCPCLLEAHLFTNLLFSAFHLQRPKSNIYVHFHLVNKQLMRILELELSVKHVSNLKVKNIMEVTALYHSRESVGLMPSWYSFSLISLYGFQDFKINFIAFHDKVLISIEVIKSVTLTFWTET